jgi:hypothetical protein
MRNLDEVPFLPDVFHRINESRFAEAMENVLQVVDGVDDDQAMRIVDAVLGPLLLISPPPHTSLDSQCRHRYYHERDGWLFCTKDHGVPDDDPHAHRSEAQDWDSDMPKYNPRAFAPAKRSWQ